MVSCKSYFPSFRVSQTSPWGLQEYVTLQAWVAFQLFSGQSRRGQRRYYILCPSLWPHTTAEPIASCIKTEGALTVKPSSQLSWIGSSRSPLCSSLITRASEFDWESSRLARDSCLNRLDSLDIIWWHVILDDLTRTGWTGSWVSRIIGVRWNLNPECKYMSGTLRPILFPAA